ncbi:MAG: heme NO-binding domain-containing protein [Thermodesulfobacterium sp.]|nr:heme NO-binding domain-containing protein [Thermodesulfobacterium sp.]
MKGVIVNALAEMMEEKFGKKKWDDILQKSGFTKGTVFLPTQDINDDVFKIINTLCKELNISLQQAFDAFGEYWACSFAPKLYAPFYSWSKSAKDFLLKMDKVHSLTTKSIPNARPPRFKYEWKDDKTLIMTYESPRKLIDLSSKSCKRSEKVF